MLNAKAYYAVADNAESSVEVVLDEVESGLSNNVFLQPTPPELSPWGSSERDSNVVCDQGSNAGLPRFDLV